MGIENGAERVAAGYESREGAPAQTAFDRATESMTSVLEAYKDAKKEGKGLSEVDLYEFPEMMAVVREAEREYLEGVLRGEATDKLEDSPEFKALAHNTDASNPIKYSHIYGVRRQVIEELEREGKDVSELWRTLSKDTKDHPDA